MGHQFMIALCGMYSETCMLCVQNQGCKIPQHSTSKHDQKYNQFYFAFESNFALCEVRNLLLVTVKMTASVKYWPTNMRT